MATTPASSASSLAARGLRDAAPAPAGESALMTVAEVATVLRVSKMTVYRLVNAGELQALRVGRSVRVPEQAVTAYLVGARVA